MGSSFKFFGLDHAPFVRNCGTGQDLCWTDAARAAAAWLREVLARGERRCWITGSSGTGKSALLQLLVAEEQGQRPWRIVNPVHFTTEALMAALQAQRPTGTEPGQAFFGAPGTGPVLVVDHTERYPEAALRACLQWQHLVGQQISQPPSLVLVGLEARDHDPGQDAGDHSDIPAAVYALQPLTPGDAFTLLEHRLLRAGKAGPGLLPPATREVAHNLSHGNPGILLDLCDMALYLAAFHGRRQITPECIREAAAYQGLLPVTGVPHPAHTAVCAVIRRQAELPGPTTNRPRRIAIWNLVAGMVAVALGTWWTLQDTRLVPSFLNQGPPPVSTQEARTRNEIPLVAPQPAAQPSPAVPDPTLEASISKPLPLPSPQQLPGKERAAPDEVAHLLHQASSGMGQYFVNEEALLRRLTQLPSPAASPQRDAEIPARDGGSTIGQEGGKGAGRPTDVVQAAAAGNLQAVQELLGQGIAVNSADDQGETALLKAAWLGSAEMATLLLNKGAEVNRQSKIGNTALLFAAIKGHRAVAELLLSRGAGINQADRTGRTPLMAAALNGHREVVALLLAQRANPNGTTRDGWTPMMYAALADHREIGQLLLHAGANPGLKNREGLDCFQVANQQGHGGFASLLGQTRR